MAEEKDYSTVLPTTKYPITEEEKGGFTILTTTHRVCTDCIYNHLNTLCSKENIIFGSRLFKGQRVTPSWCPYISSTE